MKRELTLTKGNMMFNPIVFVRRIDSHVIINSVSFPNRPSTGEVVNAIQKLLIDLDVDRYFIDISEVEYLFDKKLPVGVRRK